MFANLKRLAMALGIGVSALLPMQANAAPNLELALVIDGSGSIGAANFAAQMAAYVTALNAVLPTNGSVAVGVWVFSTNVTNVFVTQVINNAADLLALTTAISGAAYPNANTAIGDAINAAAAQLLGNAIVSNKQIIDVSTDGINNVGIAPGPAAAAVVAAGIEQVNCLGIGAAADCSFIAGAGAFSETATGFLALEDALKRKIGKEIPEPGSLALLGLGLAGLAFARRRTS